jgi:hypothetical protein
MLLLLIGALILAPLELTQVASAAPDGAIHVAVRAAGTSAPIAGAKVTARQMPDLSSGPANRQSGLFTGSATTDEAGNAVFEHLPMGNYSVQAERDGYITPSLALGLSTPSPRDSASAVLTPQDPSKEVSITLAHSGAISGHLRDQDGHPIANARVTAYSVYYHSGRPWLGPGPNTQSNSSGAYRLQPLGPGEFYVAIEGPKEFPVFYPGVLDIAAAAPIRIRNDEEVTGTDFTVAPVRTFKVSGTVLNVPIRTLRNGQKDGSIPVFTVVPADAATDTPPAAVMNTLKGGNGEFEVKLPPGSWDVFTTVPNSVPGGASLSGRTRVVVVDGDVSGVIIPLISTAVKGSVRMPATANARFSSRISLVPRENLLAPGASHVLSSNGTFSFEGMLPGKYSIEIAAIPIGYYVADLRIGYTSIYDDGIINVGADALEPIEVVLQQGGGTIQGMLEDDNVQPRGEYIAPRMLLVPAWPRRQNPLLYKTSTLIGAPGAFSFRNVPPGDYKVFAWKRFPLGAEQNSTFIGRYEQYGVTVTVLPGERSPVTVRLTPED